MHVLSWTGPADYVPGKFITIVPSISSCQVAVVGQSLGLTLSRLTKSLCVIYLRISSTAY